MRRRLGSTCSKCGRPRQPGCTRAHVHALRFRARSRASPQWRHSPCRVCRPQLRWRPSWGRLASAPAWGPHKIRTKPATNNENDLQKTRTIWCCGRGGASTHVLSFFFESIGNLCYLIIRDLCYLVDHNTHTFTSPPPYFHHLSPQPLYHRYTAVSLGTSIKRALSDRQ